ncbi:MAG TPA: hypothetical protein VGB84_07650 [Arachidicoccus sp.]
MGKISLAISFVAMVILVSCSSILNNEQETITISTNKSIKNIKLYNGILIDSIQNKSAKSQKYTVYRSREPLRVELQTDSSVKTYQLNAKHSSAYWWNIPSNFGWGLLVDQLSQKRFTYPSYSFFPMNDSAHVKEVHYLKRTAEHRCNSDAYRSYISSRAGTVDFRITYHIVNDIEVKYKNIDEERAGGLIGLGIGTDFYTKNNQFISFDLGVGTSHEFIAETLGPDTLSSVLYGNVRYNHVVGRFNLGYGINFSRYRLYEEKDSASQTYRNTALGLSLFVQYKLTNNFGVGILYQPGIYTITKATAGFSNQNYFSVNLNFIILCKSRRMAWLFL